MSQKKEIHIQTKPKKEIETQNETKKEIETKNETEPKKEVESKIESENDQLNKTSNKEEKEIPKKKSLHAKYYKIFADENSNTFFRRLSWTSDGSFLITPSSYYLDEALLPKQKNLNTTYVFSRNSFPNAVMHFPTLNQNQSVCVRSNPKLFKKTTKENSNLSLNYRLIVGIATMSTVFVYDLDKQIPLCVVEGLHYADLTDLAWSPDGYHLLVASRDGYCSIISFTSKELGEYYVAE